MLVMYILLCVCCLMAGAISAHYSERVRQGEEDMRRIDANKAELQREVDRLRHTCSQFERETARLRDARDAAETRAKEIEEERDQMRRYFSRSISPRPRSATPHAQAMRAIHA